MFTEQILKSILSLKAFSATARARKPALEGIYISVDAEANTITATATDRYAVARMVIMVPRVDGTSWGQNVSLATLNAALASVKAGESVSVFPEAYMPEFPTIISGVIDNFINAEDAPCVCDFNAKYLGAIAKINVGGDKSGRWTIRTVIKRNQAALAATASYANYDAAVAVMPLRTS